VGSCVIRRGCGLGCLGQMRHVGGVGNEIGSSLNPDSCALEPLQNVISSV
jgi:hypothetical protein